MAQTHAQVLPGFSFIQQRSRENIIFHWLRTLESSFLKGQSYYYAKAAVLGMFAFKCITTGAQLTMRGSQGSYSCASNICGKQVLLVRAGRKLEDPASCQVGSQQGKLGCHLPFFARGGVMGKWKRPSLSLITCLWLLEGGREGKRELCCS